MRDCISENRWLFHDMTADVAYVYLFFSFGKKYEEKKVGFALRERQREWAQRPEGQPEPFARDDEECKEVRGPLDVNHWREIEQHVPLSQRN